MLTAFWQALMCHDYWNSNDPHAERALFVYQDKQRWPWHKAIPLTDGAWEISVLDHQEIRMTLDEPYQEDRRRRRDDEQDLFLDFVTASRFMRLRDGLPLCVNCAFNLCTPKMSRMIIHRPIVPGARGIHPGVIAKEAEVFDAQPLLPHIITQVPAGTSCVLSFLVFL
ncbi:hypothetical protein BDR04DRAFT_1146957 [Suillus decipiens]|nr:hypothetical protein BDR04DRAFT_1146957 [Suillus decipiens]